MNWYKIAQVYAPIAIVSYVGGDLGISFNGGKKYVYERINQDDYERIDNLLRYSNYKAAQKMLANWTPKKEETEEEKQEMLNELYERGILK